jgi:hypothetical protein
MRVLHRVKVGSEGQPLINYLLMGNSCMAKATPLIGLATDTTHEDSGEVDPLKSCP